MPVMHHECSIVMSAAVQTYYEARCAIWPCAHLAFAVGIMNLEGVEDQVQCPLNSACHQGSETRARLRKVWLCICLQQPGVPVLVHQEVKAKQLEAVGQCEEGQLPTDRLNRLAWSCTGCISSNGAILLHEASMGQRWEAMPPLPPNRLACSQHDIPRKITAPSLLIDRSITTWPAYSWLRSTYAELGMHAAAPSLTRQACDPFRYFDMLPHNLAGLHILVAIFSMATCDLAFAICDPGRLFDACTPARQLARDSNHSQQAWVFVSRLCSRQGVQLPVQVHAGACVT